jgi:hypothetical protein
MIENTIKKTVKMRHDPSVPIKLIIKRLDALTDFITKKKVDPRQLHLFDAVEKKELMQGIGLLSNRAQEYFIETIKKARILVDKSIKEIQLDNLQGLELLKENLVVGCVLFGYDIPQLPSIGERIKLTYDDTLMSLAIVRSIKIATLDEVTKLDLHDTQFYSFKSDYQRVFFSMCEKAIGRTPQLDEKVTILRWKLIDLDRD